MDPQIPYVIAVYLVIWAALMVLALVMNNRISNLQKELSIITREVEKKNSK
ncbi:MAG: hypothetical protein HY779_00355 [Rubrobacteridae bacterium]|nr:hypothetical protein [Rubrobacteridae bacterium]